MKTIRFVLTFKQGVKELARVEGLARPADVLTVADVTEKVLELEQLVERLTGLRCHVESAMDESFPHIDALPISEDRKAELRDIAANPDPRD